MNIKLKDENKLVNMYKIIGILNHYQSDQVKHWEPKTFFED